MSRPASPSPRPRSTNAPKAGSRTRAGKPQPLDLLDSFEKARVLDELLRCHPELRSESQRIARENLTDTDVEGIAEDVERTLRSLPSTDLAGRAGRQRWGYVEPVEAAWDMLSEAVEVYERGVERLLELRMSKPAASMAFGVILGLYRCRDCVDGDKLLSWGTDFPLDRASDLVHLLDRHGVRLPPQFVADSIPDWADSLNV